MTSEPATSEEPERGEPQLFHVWVKYQDTAAHFNDLVMRLRTQALAGIAVLVVLAEVATSGGVSSELRWTLLADAFFLLALFWFAICILDFGYYDRLLDGAFAALLRIEARSKRTSGQLSLDLSTTIEQALRRAPLRLPGTVPIRLRARKEIT